MKFKYKPRSRELCHTFCSENIYPDPEKGYKTSDPIWDLRGIEHRPNLALKPLRKDEDGFRDYFGALCREINGYAHLLGMSFDSLDQINWAMNDLKYEFVYKNEAPGWWSSLIIAAK